ncbi:MAG TPA: VOC family protein [Alphaproteobacteria bacterium]|nr:VOC family protein [Alphaproteobacteria bacterium]
MNVIGIDHVNLTCQAALEEATIAFYRDVLGLTRVPKPPSQRPSGAWLQIGNQQIHLSVDDNAPRDSQLAASRHVCFRVADLGAAEAALRAAGAPVTPDARPIPGIHRLFTRDPAGNNLELAEHGAGA